MRSKIVKSLDATGSIFIGLGYASVLVLTLVVKSAGDGKTEDLIGFIIPHPPTSLGMIPWLGFILERIYEMFSLHGLAVICVLFLLVAIGLGIKKIAKKYAMPVQQEDQGIEKLKKSVVNMLQEEQNM